MIGDGVVFGIDMEMSSDCVIDMIMVLSKFE